MKLKSLIFTGLVGSAVAVYIPADEVSFNKFPDVEGRLLVGDLGQNRNLIEYKGPHKNTPKAPVQSEMPKEATFSFYNILRYFNDKKKGKYDDEYGSYFDNSDDEYCSDSDDGWYDPFDDMEPNDSDSDGCEDGFDIFYESDYDSDYDDFDDMMKYYKLDATDNYSRKRKILKYVFDKQRLNEKKLIKEIRKLTNSTMEPVREMVNDIGVSASQAEMLTRAWYKFYNLFAPLKTKLVNKLQQLTSAAKSQDKKAHAMKASVDGNFTQANLTRQRQKKVIASKAKAQPGSKKIQRKFSSLNSTDISSAYGNISTADSFNQVNISSSFNKTQLFNSTFQEEDSAVALPYHRAFSQFAAIILLYVVFS